MPGPCQILSVSSQNNSSVTVSFCMPIYLQKKSGRLEQFRANGSRGQHFPREHQSGVMAVKTKMSQAAWPKVTLRFCIYPGDVRLIVQRAEKKLSYGRWKKHPAPVSPTRDRFLDLHKLSSLKLQQEPLETKWETNGE